MKEDKNEIDATALCERIASSINALDGHECQLAFLKNVIEIKLLECEKSRRLSVLRHRQGSIHDL